MSLLAYLKQRRGAVLLLCVCCGLFVLSFRLYALPMDAAVYPGLLCLLVLACACGADYARLRKRHLHLQALLARTDQLPDALPRPCGALEEDYQALATLLCREQRERASVLSARYEDMMDYYTAWAHQIKTPIAAMQLHLQQADSPLSRTLTPEILRVEQYVDMVMAYLRLDADTTDYVIRECDVDAIIQKAVRRFAGEFIARRLTLRYQPLGLRAVTDEKWLQFVLEQLLSNALKYTPSGGVTIDQEEPGMLCVRDTGVGIAPEELPRIFEKGFTGEMGRSDRRASGIGLYLCRRICRGLGHGLSAASRPGEGTVIRIDLRQATLSVE